MKKIKFIDLFAGMGGFRLGFESALKELGYETECVFTSEIKSHAIRVLEDNYEHNKFEGDITEITANQIPDFDVLLAGFPCQSFSFAGKRLGFSDTRGTMFFEIERILKEKKPKAFILENVEGLIKHDYTKDSKNGLGNTFNVILDSLTSLGYKIDWKLLNSVDFGIPQERKRVFIIGHLDYPVSITNLSTSSSQLKDILEHEENIEETEFSKKLLSFYSPEELQGKKINDKRGGNNNIHSWDFDLKGETTQKQKVLMNDLLKNRRRKSWASIIGIKWMDGMPLTAEQIFSFTSEYYSSQGELEKDLLDLTEKGYLKFEHPKDRIDGRRVPRKDLPKGYNIVAGNLSFEYNRILDPEGVTPTLVATDMTKLGVVDNGVLRPLSIKEGLALCGYPNDFKMNVSRDEAYDLLGNTVVIPVVEEVSKRLFIKKSPIETLKENKRQLSLF